jgi:photosystem II stability/assembly factor-like uncharacterized protein
MVISLALDPTNVDTAYVAGTEGVFKTVDGGATWSPANTGLNSATITAFATDAAGGRLYAGTDNIGVWAGAEAGTTWSPINTGISPMTTGDNSHVTAVLVDPAQPATLYTSLYTQGVFKSTDAGQTWAKAMTDLPSLQTFNDLAIDPEQPSTLYLAAAGAANTLFATSNGGETWFALDAAQSPNSARTITVDPTAPLTVYVSTATGLLVKTTDGFATWTELAGTGWQNRIVVDATAPATLYALKGRPTYKSLDAGATWFELTRSPALSALAIDPINPSRLYGAAPEVGLYVSTDGGATWALQPDESLTNILISALAIGEFAAQPLTIGSRSTMRLPGVTGYFLWAGTQDSGGASGVFRKDITCAGVTSCTNGDGCCPAGCDAGNDADCQPSTRTPTPTAALTMTPTPGPTAALTMTPTPGPTATIGLLDHFTCYKAGATRGSEKFPGIANLPGVSLVDQFGSSTDAVKKPGFLCAPTNKLGEDPTAPTHPEHLTGYQIKNLVKPLFPTNITVIDQFNPGGIKVDAKKQSHLLVPTVKSLTGPTPVPMPGAFTVDHFQCYKVSITGKTPKFEPVLNAVIEDQFGIMHVDVKKPQFLCNPVDKNGEDPSAPTHVSHLMCYQVKQVKTEPKFLKVVGVFVNNQFGPETLDVKKPSALCVPAVTNP